MIQNSKGPQKGNPGRKTRQVKNMPWWVEATRCLFPIATDIPQHVGRRKRRAAVLPPIHLMCMFQFISVLQFFTYAFSNIWIVGSVSTYSLGARRNPLHARLYTYIYIIVSEWMSDGAWPDLDVHIHGIVLFDSVSPQRWRSASWRELGRLLCCILKFRWFLSGF